MKFNIINGSAASASYEDLKIEYIVKSTHSLYDIYFISFKNKKGNDENYFYKRLESEPSNLYLIA